MKTSYYLVAAAGLTAAAVTVYAKLPLRAQTPLATLPMPHDPAATVLSVPDVPLPPIVPPPDGDLALPTIGAATPFPALPTPAGPLGLPPPPALPTPPSSPVTPVTPLPVPPPTATPVPAAPTVPVIPPVAAPEIKPINPIVPVVPPATEWQTAPAPRPVAPGAPPEPKPLPLPAPTPFTPGLDGNHPDAAVKLAPAGTFIVMKGNKLIEGTATVMGDRVIVRRGALDRSYPKVDVQYVAGSKDEVVRFMLAKAPANNADSRYAVARWCTMNGLREQALAEAREVLRMQPGHRGAADLARSVEESLRLYPADGSQPKPQGVLITVVEPEPDVSAEGATTFVSRAQPILANQCMECHARDDHASGFKLKRVTGFEVGPQSTHANLRAVAGQLKKDEPAISPLLVRALTAHGGMKQPAFVSRQAVAFKALEAWVSIAVGNASVPTMPPPAPPGIPTPPAVAPIPPANGASAPAGQTVLPPAEPNAVPPILPTPASIPVAEPMSRPAQPLTPALPRIPVIPSAGLPAKPPSQFGTGSQPPAPAGADEFDPAAYNQSLPPVKK